MKKLIVYYSMEGNTHYIAEKMAEKLSADLLRLVPKKAYIDKGFAKFIWGGKSAVMAEKPKLMPYSVDFSLYDEIIIGFPIWASTITPPIRTFVCDNLNELKEKKISVYACQAGNGAEKAMAKLQALLGIEEFKATAVFIDPKTRPSEKNDKILSEFCNKIQGIFENDFARIEFIKKDNVVFHTWKKEAHFDDYRTPVTASLELLREHKGSIFVVDARNGFEDTKEDVEWGFNYFLPETKKTGCKIWGFILPEISHIEGEIDLWTTEIEKNFKVIRATSYDEVLKMASDFEKNEH
ncbi:MAG: hypothetical protein IJL70_05410 [Treponema sp.]|nr:hypothetical protein [Treponema sp.]